MYNAWLTKAKHKFFPFLFLKNKPHLFFIIDKKIFFFLPRFWKTSLLSFEVQSVNT